jgi:hypothetical protein
MACASDYRCRDRCAQDSDCNATATNAVCAKDANGVRYCVQPSEVALINMGTVLAAAPPPGADTGRAVIEPDAGP